MKPAIDPSLPFEPAASNAAPVGNRLRLGAWTIDLADARQMGRLTIAFLAFHLLLWVVLATISHRAPPWDNIEQLVWMQSLEWGYYKHPPFPTWWVHFWTSIFGREIWVTFFAAQLNVVLMLVLVWRIALHVTDPVRAFAATVLSSLLIYHGLHGIMANHNTLQLMPVALLLWLSLHAVRDGGWWRWALVGAAAALCLLTKYSALIWLAIIGAWLLQDQRMRSLRAWAGPLMALLVCAVLVGPHIEWLVREGAPSLSYVNQAVNGEHDASTMGHWGRLGNFLVIQLARALPLLLGVGLLRLMLRRAPRQLATGEPQRPEWRFVAIMTLGPVLLTSLLGVAGVKLGSAWAATFFIMLGVMAMRWIPAVVPAQLVKAVLIVGLVMELVLASGMAIGSGWLVDMTNRPARSNFPSVRLAKELDRIWAEQMQQPLRVIVGETWLAGNVSVRSRHQPMVFIDADPAKAPWIRPEMMRDCGALLVIDRRNQADPLDPRVNDLLLAAKRSGMVDIPWTRHESGPRLIVEWAIVEPANPNACPR
ncbi:glycosyltransferase family 39 protein [Paucibacter sp. APW11]|uniref:Glycosyltransferase family 39 protein n=1 Tax=Roseateles aquae TaxID=3077235 RepID=A0ABU3P9K5_9BURK|nr:glycosyltransferase family 39 protein [Paucibacter sp. APW11]MDT8999256.1 glycosyltransferase family 39 protein [Paucibacter sp. APW11]